MIFPKIHHSQISVAIIIFFVATTSIFSSFISAHSSFDQEQELILEKESSSSSSSAMSSTTTKKFLRSEPFKLERGPWKTFDPFMFCVYHKDIYPAAEKGTLAPPEHHKRGRQMGSDFSYKDGWSYYHGGEARGGAVGFPAHPHRALSTITITLNNSSPIDHFDNTGATARYGRGDTQWMSAFAGKNGDHGIVHSEMFPLLDENGPNTLELFQIWIKIPNANVRKDDPQFKMFWSDQIPIAKIPVEGHEGVFSEVKVVVGDYPHNLPFKPPMPPTFDYAADPNSQAAIYVIQLPKKGASVKLPPMRTATANRAIYVYIADDEGSARVKIQPSAASSDESGNIGGSLRFRQGIQIAPDVETVISNEGSGENIGVLVISGEPLAEPTQSYGPFVGANMDDIEKAFADYRRTSFGGWPWGKPDVTHPREMPRMAIHSKGAPTEYPPGYEPSTSKQ